MAVRATATTKWNIICHSTHNDITSCPDLNSQMRKVETYLLQPRRCHKTCQFGCKVKSLMWKRAPNITKKMPVISGSEVTTSLTEMSSIQSMERKLVRLQDTFHIQSMCMWSLSALQNVEKYLLINTYYIHSLHFIFIFSLYNCCDITEII